MIPVAEALARILAAAPPVGTEIVSLRDAAGRVLAEDVAARVTQPPSDVSAMDGYAVRGTDVQAPTVLRRIGEAPAGAPFSGTVGPGEAVRIFTGAAMPAGADTVVIQENTHEADGQVTVDEPTAVGRHVRRAGLDFRAGSVVLAAGRRLGARDIGLAAAMNVPWLRVRRRPRVALLATGDEVVLPGEPIGPGQIVSSNIPALIALVRASGGEAVDLGIAADTIEAFREKAAGAAGTDLLVTTGGASVGDYDLVRAGLEADGFDVDFWKIAMRPGKPLMFGRWRAMPVLGLPGNPVSSFVCAVLFLRPLIARLAGVPVETATTVPAVLGVDLPANDTRQDYLRATLVPGPDGIPVVAPFTVQDSAMMSSLARADALIVRPPHAPAAAAGDRVEIVPLAGL